MLQIDWSVDSLQSVSCGAPLVFPFSSGHSEKDRTDARLHAKSRNGGVAPDYKKCKTQKNNQNRNHTFRSLG